MSLDICEDAREQKRAVLSDGWNCAELFLRSFVAEPGLTPSPIRRARTTSECYVPAGLALEKLPNFDAVKREICETRNGIDGYSCRSDAGAETQRRDRVDYGNNIRKMAFDADARCV